MEGYQLEAFAPTCVRGSSVSESTALATGQLWEVKTRYKM